MKSKIADLEKKGINPTREHVMTHLENIKSFSLRKYFKKSNIDKVDFFRRKTIGKNPKSSTDSSATNNLQRSKTNSWQSSLDSTSASCEPDLSASVAKSSSKSVKTSSAEKISGCGCRAKAIAGCDPKEKTRKERSKVGCCEGDFYFFFF